MKKCTIVALALSAVACGDSPTAPGREITLYFCDKAWVAYQNEGEAWRSLPPAPREATFRATERLAIAIGAPGTTPQLEIRYLTAEQAEAIFICGAPGSGTPTGKELHGSVAGIASDATVVIQMGRDAASATAASPTFQLDAVSDGPVDLVAALFPPPSSTEPSFRADKFIIRHGVNHADGATMPALDFSSSEAFAPQLNTLTLEGLPPTVSSLSMVQDFVTQRGTNGFLMYDFDLGSSTTVVTTYSLPASRVADGDLHRIDVGNADRRILFFYRTPADRTLSAGPNMSLPVFTQPTASPDEVLRMDVASQPEYGSQVSMMLTQFVSSTNKFVAVRATKEYFGGTPTTWSLVLPDLTGVPGFSPAWGLSPGETGWTVGATGVPHHLPPASWRDCDVYRGASVHGFTIIRE
jgi:hypothetical protein